MPVIWAFLTMIFTRAKAPALSRPTALCVQFSESLHALIVNKLMLRLVPLIALIVLLNGCASMSKEQCLTANWLDQGFQDGRNGQTLTRLEDHRKACEKVGVIPDRSLYLEGRDQGITHYCTAENGLRQGRNGKPYLNSCPAHLQHEFLIAYEQGRELYNAEKRVNDLDYEVSELEQSIRDEDDKKQRRRLRQDLRDLDRELQRARDDKRDLKRRLDEAKGEQSVITVDDQTQNKYLRQELQSLKRELQRERDNRRYLERRLRY